MKMPSKAFMEGFAEGFASPMLWLLPKKIERPMKKEATVEAAWRNVGEHLWWAVGEFEKSLDEAEGVKKTRKTKRVKVSLSRRCRQASPMGGRRIRKREVA